MPRKLKPYSVSTVVDRESGWTIDIKLDRETKQFFADIQGAIVSAPTAPACETLVYEKCKELAMYDWKKIIVVETDAPFGARYPGVRFGYEVHEIAEKPGCRGYRHLERVACDDRRFSDTGWTIRDYGGSTESASQRGVYVLPWSEATEAALAEIQRRILLLKDRLDALLGAEDAVAQLQAVVSGQPLLPAGTETRE